MKPLRLKLMGLLGTGLVLLQVTGCAPLDQITSLVKSVLGNIAGLFPTA